MLEIKNLCVRYGEKIVFDNFDLRVGDREILCVLGKSGCGKTTLLNAVAGLVPHTGDVRGAERVSYMFQEDRLIGGLNAIGNIVAAGGSASSAYSLLHDFRFTDELIFKPCSELSGGEKRRVAIARALICGGGILIFDEPFKGIDDETLSEAVLPKVKELSDSKTLLLITHSRAEAEELCSRTEKMEE